MKKVTKKTLALKINPNLKAKKNRENLWSICDGDTTIASANYPSDAWIKAHKIVATNQFKVGDLLVMQDCAEADLYKNRVWECRYPSYETASGDFAVFLEGMTGFFCSEFLRKATKDEANTYLGLI